MPYLIVCPNCSAKFKAAQPVPAGRSLTCPQCQRPFTLSAPAPELKDPPASAPVPVAKPVPPRAAIPTGKLEDPLPDAIFVDEDEDDPPRARRRRTDDEDDDDRPRPRKRAAAVDDDADLPQAEDRPRRRKKKSNKPLILGLAAGGGALLLLLLCGGVLWFVDPFGLFGGASGDMLAWAPADAQMLMFVDVEELRKVDELRGEPRSGPLHASQFGIQAEDVAAVLGAGRAGKLLHRVDPDVQVYKLKGDADRPAIINANGGTRATANGKDYYKTRTGGALYFPSDRMVVIAKNESALTDRLGKDEGKVVVSDDLRAAAGRGEGLVWMAATGQAAEQSDFIGVAAWFANKGTPPRAKATIWSLTVSGNVGTVRQESTYDSADAARRIADDLRRTLEVGRVMRDPSTTEDVSVSGATVTKKSSGPIRKGAGLFPGF